MPLQLKLIFLLISGTSITFINQNWFLAWLGLEISSIASISFLLSTPNSRQFKITSRYILTQIFTSLMMMPIILYLFFKTGLLIVSFTKPLLAFLIMFNLLMKLGLASFYFYLPEGEHALPTEMKIILASIQMIAPLL